MDFIYFTMAAMLILFLVLVGLARIVPGSGREILDWTPTRSYETEAMLEMDDMAQMLEAQNARRRASGRPELTESDVRKLAQEDQAFRERARPIQEKLAAELQRFDEEMARAEQDDRDPAG